MPYTDADHIKHLEAQVAGLKRRIAAAVSATRSCADHGTILRALEAGDITLAELAEADLLRRLVDIRRAPTLGHAVTSQAGQRMLFLERPRAEQAAKDSGGTWAAWDDGRTVN